MLLHRRHLVAFGLGTALWTLAACDRPAAPDVVEPDDAPETDPVEPPPDSPTRDPEPGDPALDPGAPPSDTPSDLNAVTPDAPPTDPPDELPPVPADTAGDDRDGSDAATDPDVAEGQCETWGRPRMFARLPGQVTEASGLSVSRFDPSILWMHNDSGDEAALYAVDSTTGELVSTVRLDGVPARDWEDMSAGPCRPGSTARDCLYVANIGDNHGVQPQVEIIRMAEPDPRLSRAYIEDRAEIMRVVYPDGPRDAEAIAVDENGRVFVFSKLWNGRFGVYSTLFQPGPTPVTLEFHATLPILDDGSDNGEAITAADWDPVRRSLLLRTYSRILEYRLPEGVTMRDLAAASKARVPNQAELQGETVAWGPDGYWHVSEGRSRPLYFIGCP